MKFYFVLQICIIIALSVITICLNAGLIADDHSLQDKLKYIIVSMMSVYTIIFLEVNLMLCRKLL